MTEPDVLVQPPPASPAPSRSLPSLKMVDLARQHEPLRHELEAAIGRVIESSAFIGGHFVAEFLEAFSAYLDAGKQPTNAAHSADLSDSSCSSSAAVGCASGTDALQLALMALGVGPGDEVITSPFTFVATAETIALLGARPVFVDIDPTTFNMRPDLVEAHITAKTKAILPVHLYGQPADLQELGQIASARGLPLVEDVAQATGALYGDRRAGTVGDIACFSFFPAKNLGCLGDGGAVVCRDEAVAKRVRLLANHGASARYRHTSVGINSRLDGLQAAVLSVKLRYLESFNEQRRRAAAQYTEALRPLEGERFRCPSVAPGRSHVFQQYTVRVEQRDALAQFLSARGIPNAVHYPTPLHRQPAFADRFGDSAFLPEAERAAQEVLSLPIFPGIREEEVAHVALAVVDCLTSL